MYKSQFGKMDPYDWFCGPECVIYTVGAESIQTPLNFSLFVILQPFAKII